MKSVSFDIARPGESVRIMPVKDVIEPRVKVSGEGGYVPGYDFQGCHCWKRKDKCINGIAVVTTGKIVGFQEGIIDMCGTGAEYTPFSKLNNLVVICEPVDGIKACS
ncbi:MAG: glycine/sarcosine/betaine reductase component B subunit [Lachnoclostridium sp.]